MVFFDLNVPYLESSGSQKPLPDNNSRKNTRLKVAVKAMELGYSGVAYNRSMKGVMSDSDRCTIFLFPISSLLKAAPTLSTSVKFHREVLGVPLNSPFRQYTRLTVIVDNVVQAACLNSGNPILKTYDLIAVKPLNQTVFDQACKVSEVDLISIDFSEKLSFRLKLPMVKAAIERGVFFEITYSNLISDVQARRQMVTNAKLLVDWTRGKNLIFSSAASSVNELRGPYDVANLSCLLGISMERAKAAISKNCSSLMARALRKKQFYKEAIRVESIPCGTKFEKNDLWFPDSHSWDNISSGEGDLLLDDIAKSLAAASKVPKTSKAVDFASITEELPSEGMRLRDWLPVQGDMSEISDITPSVRSPAKPLKSSVDESFKSSNRDELVPTASPMVLSSTPVRQKTCSYQGSTVPESPIQTSILFSQLKQVESSSTFCENPVGIDEVPFPVHTTPDDTPSQDCDSNCAVDLISPDDVMVDSTPEKDVVTSSALGAGLVPTKDNITENGGNLVNLMDTSEPPIDHKEVYLFPQNENPERSNSLDADVGAQNDVNLGNQLADTEEMAQIKLVSERCDMLIDADLVQEEQSTEPNTGEDLSADEKPLVPHTDNQEDGDLFANKLQSTNTLHEMEAQIQDRDSLNEMEEQKPDEHSLDEMIKRTQEAFNEIGESRSGKGKMKHKSSRQSIKFPFKHSLKPGVFKRKSKKSRNKDILW